MFYSKYRPQKFSEISRPNIAADALSKQVKNNNTAHAYLFIGSRGTGKTSTARILAKSLNCTNLDSKNGDPCGECSNCTSIKNQSLIDIVEIDAASNRGIEDIRELQSKVNLSPIQGMHKVYIIDEVHMLTSPAFNALLKTLEEPPKKVTFVLCTTEPNKVPDTVRSRCQTYLFKRATNQQLKEKLSYIAEKENYSLKEDSLNNIINSSLGGFRDAETMLQQLIEGELNTTESELISDHSLILEFIDYLQNKDSKSAIDLINNLYNRGVDLSIWLSQVIILIRSIILYQSSSSVISMQLSQDVIDKIDTKYSKTHILWYVKIVSLFLKTLGQIEQSFIPQLPIELAIITICDINKQTSTSTKKKIINPANDTNNNSKSSNNTNNDSLEASKNSKDSNKKTKIDTKNTSKDTLTKDISFENIIEENVSFDIEQINNSNENNDISDDIDLSNKITQNNSAQENISEDNIEQFSSLELSEKVVKKEWPKIIQQVKESNTALFTILKTSKFVEIVDNKLLVEVFFEFHKERLEHSSNKKIFEDAISNILNTNATFLCKLSDKKPTKLKDREVGVLTDANVVPVETKDLMNMFDGSLPV